MALAIYPNTQTVVVVDNIADSLGKLTISEFLAGSGTMTVYSDSARTSAVANASSLTVYAFAGQTEFPARLYVEIPSNASITVGSNYYGVLTWTATDVSEGQTIPLKNEPDFIAKRPQ